MPICIHRFYSAHPKMGFGTFLYFLYIIHSYQISGEQYVFTESFLVNMEDGIYLTSTYHFV